MYKLQVMTGSGKKQDLRKLPFCANSALVKVVNVPKIC